MRYHLYIIIGVTKACAHSLGMRPTDIRDSNISDKGVANAGASCLNKSGGKPSGPPDLLGFSYFIAASTLAGEKSTVSKDTLSCTTRLTGGILPSSMVQTELK